MYQYNCMDVPNELKQNMKKKLDGNYCKIISVVIDYINYFIDNWLYQLFYYLDCWGCGLVKILIFDFNFTADL